MGSDDGNGKAAISGGINSRLIAFVTVIAFLVGYPVFQYGFASWSNGVSDAGNGLTAVDLKALGNFPFDDENGTINDIPHRFRELDGKKVVLEGFMANPNSAGQDVWAFEFVYNRTICCFLGPPMVQERVFAHISSGNPVRFRNEMVRCVGTLHIRLHKNDGGKIDAVYDMDVDRVEQM